MQKKTAHITIYKASAGSGKTYALTKEYIRLLLRAPGNFKHILAVTFTNKASGEMKERILYTLYAISNKYDSVQYANELCEEFSLKPIELQEKAQRVLHDILHNYSFFYVETIDTFFQRIIRNFAKELGLQSYFGLELDINKIIQLSLQELFANIHEQPTLQQWLIDYSYAQIDEGKSRNVFDNLMKDSKILFQEDYMKLSQNPIPFTDIVAFFASLEQSIEAFQNKVCDLALQAIGIIASHGLECADFKGVSASCMKPLYAISQKQYDVKLSKLEQILSTDNWFTKTSQYTHLVALLEQAGLLRMISSIYELFAGAEGVKYRTALLMKERKYSVGMLQAMQQSIDTYCKEQDVFLISNTNMFLQSIIQDSDAPFVYEKIGCFIRHIMIDEFQDTSHMQWRNFLPLISNAVSEGGSALVVGDVKQSIYRFRNGDWSLLHDKIYSDFAQNISEISLQQNWRSRAHVIQFNNTFFTLFSSSIQHVFSKQLQEQGLGAISETLQAIIPSLYADVEQHIPARSNDGGYVQVLSISPQEGYDYQQSVFEQLLADVLQLFKQGYVPDDIVFLCKDKKQIREIVAFFNQKKREYPHYAQAFSIVTGEGLALSESTVIQFVLAYLQWIEQPYNRYFKALVYTLYEQLHNQQDVCDIAFVNSVETLLGVEPRVSKTDSLYQIIETILHDFALNEITDEFVYIVEFQNVVYSYAKNNSVSISQFMEWWNEKQADLYIKQEPQGYMRAMTIHKSKGLQFSVVLLPFVNWKFSKPNIPIICDTAHTDFSAMPFAYVSQNKALGDSQFSEQYAVELMQNYIDNLNVLYVACTRAVDVLCMYVPEKSNKDTISNAVAGCLPYIDVSALQRAEGGSLYVGEIPKRVQTELVHTPLVYEYPIYNEQPALLPVPETIRFVERMFEQRAEQLHGIRMHRLFEFVIHIEDIPAAVNKIIAEGLLKKTDRDAYIDYCTHAIEQSNAMQWFDTAYTIVTEQGILTPQGEKRPDRIVFTSDTTLDVIDYKFTIEQDATHIRQVQEYTTILNSMGYHTKGYVWYVLQNRVVGV